MKEIEYYRLNFFENDEPVPYELNNGEIIYIYPIKVKEYNLYDTTKSIMEIQKNDINNIEIIKMSYLDFIVNVLFNSEKENEYKDFFVNFITLILHKEYVGIEYVNGKLNVTVSNNGKNKIYIKSKELDEITKISFYQNDYKYKDLYISPDVRKEIAEYMKLRYGNQHTPTLEEKKAFVISKTGILMKDINDMTYRSFSLVYASALDSEIYISKKIIQASYKYDVKEEINHPLFTEDKDIIDTVFATDAEKFEQKISAVNG